MKSSFGVLVNTGLALTVGVLSTLLYMEKRKKLAVQPVAPGSLPEPMSIQSVPAPPSAPAPIESTQPAETESVLTPVLTDAKDDRPKQIVLNISVPEGVKGTPDISVLYPGWVPEMPSKEEITEELERVAPRVKPPVQRGERSLLEDPLLAEELLVRTLDYIDDSTQDIYSSSTSSAMQQIVWRRAEEVAAAVSDLREFLRRYEIQARPRRK